MQEKRRILVIGGTACGPKAAARARRCDPYAEITVVEQAAAVSTGTCGLPYYVGGVIRNEADLRVRGPAYFKNVMDIEVLIGTKATRINRQARTVEVLNLRTKSPATLSYDRLVLATGSTPVTPPIEGRELKGIFTLSRIEDAASIRNYASGRIKSATIVGAGLIGMEMAEALTLRGIEVTVIEALGWVMPSLLDFEMASYLAKHVMTKGVRLLFKQRVLGFTGDSSGTLRKVITEKQELEADMVILSVGRRPDVSLAREAGLEIGPYGTVAVNRHLQTSDPLIFAGGDCVANLNLVTGQPVFAPLGSTANKHGRVIGTNVTGGRDTFPGVVNTAIAKVFDYNVASSGLTEQEAKAAGYEVVVSLAPSRDHAAYYPGSQEIIVKLIAEANSGKLLGGQVVGPGDVAKRIDVLATALTCGANVDALANLDLAYAPPFNSALDPLHHAANVVRNKQSQMAECLPPSEVQRMIEAGEDFVFLDVRSEEEFNKKHIEAPQVKLIPLDKLRQNLDKLPKDAKIVTLCQASVRAYQAQRILRGAGFKNVKFVDGSLAIWPYDQNIKAG